MKFVTWCCICVFAGLLIPAVVSADDQAVPQEVTTLLSKWAEARDLGDAKMIGWYLDDSFVGVGPLGWAEDKRKFVERVSDPKLKLVKMESNDQSIRVYGQLVVVTGLYRLDGTSDGRDVSGTYRYLDVARKVGSRWVFIASTLTRVQAPPTTAPSATPLPGNQP